MGRHPPAGDSGLIPGSGRSLGERNGNPLLYPCLESSMDRRAWRAIVHGDTKSWTRLSDKHTHTHTHTHTRENPKFREVFGIKLYLKFWENLLHIVRNFNPFNKTMLVSALTFKLF